MFSHQKKVNDKDLQVSCSDTLSEILALVAEPSPTLVPSTAAIMHDSRWKMEPTEKSPRQSTGTSLKSLKYQILEAEKDVESSISTLHARSCERLDVYRKFSLNVMAVEDSETEMRELQEEGVALYLKSVAQRNVEISQLRRENRLRCEHEDDYAAEHFAWFAIIQKIYVLLKAETFSKKSWRIALYRETSNLEAVVREPKERNRISARSLRDDAAVAHVESDMEAAIRDICLDLDRFLGDPSGSFSRELELELRGVSSKLALLEAKLDSQFRTICAAKEDAALRLAAAEARWSKDHLSAGGNTPAGLAHLAIDARRAGARERLLTAKKALPPLTPSPRIEEHADQGDEAAGRMLQEAAQVVAFRGNEAALATQYHHILVWCAQRGDWKGALQVYRTLGERHLPARYPLTFTTLLLAAKNAKPRAETALVVPVMEEAELSGFALTREVFHAAMDVCRAGGHWRRALGVFNKMAAAGIAPSTHTYALLEQAGAAARGAEPAEVYEAMTFAGVPAYLSYTAAASCALSSPVNTAPLDQGPTADWVGASVLPFAGFGAKPDRTANLAHRLSSTAGRNANAANKDGTVTVSRNRLQSSRGPGAPKGKGRQNERSSQVDRAVKTTPKTAAGSMAAFKFPALEYAKEATPGEL